jgi:hypothetical protein
VELQVPRTLSVGVLLKENGSSPFLPKQLNIVEIRLCKTDIQCDPVIY